MRNRLVKLLAVVGAVLGWSALVLQLWLTIRASLANGMGVLGTLVFYFSFFTVLTNILVAMSLTAAVMRSRSGVWGFFSRPDVNTAAATNIVVVGISYTLLLQHLWDPQGPQLVADVLLHHVMPVFFVVFWWVAVERAHARLANVARWTIYPLSYFVYAMVRGAISGVYPYPFIDASQLGYPRAFGNALGVLIGFVAVALTLVAVDRLKGDAALGPSPQLGESGRR